MLTFLLLIVFLSSYAKFLSIVGMLCVRQPPITTVYNCKEENSNRGLEAVVISVQGKCDQHMARVHCKFVSTCPHCRWGSKQIWVVGGG